MTDRYNAITIILDKDIREDDAAGLLQLLKWLKHVSDVVPHVHDLEDVIAESRVRSEMKTKIYDALKDL